MLVSFVVGVFLSVLCLLVSVVSPPLSAVLVFVRFSPQVLFWTVCAARRSARRSASAGPPAGPRAGPPAEPSAELFCRREVAGSILHCKKSVNLEYLPIGRWISGRNTKFEFLFFCSSQQHTTQTNIIGWTDVVDSTTFSIFASKIVLYLLSSRDFLRTAVLLCLRFVVARCLFCSSLLVTTCESYLSKVHTFGK
jgi:hypothetical protein